MARWAFAVVCVVGIGSGSPAHGGEFFSIPLPGLVGPIADEIGETAVDVDLGRRFKRIDRVLVLVEATTTPTQFETCGTIDAPEPCMHHEIPSELLAYLVAPTFLESALTTMGPFGSSPRERAGVFEGFLGEPSFDHLLDGRGTVWLDFNSLSNVVPEVIVRDFVAPTGEIFEAILIVEGTPAKRRRGPRHE